MKLKILMALPTDSQINDLMYSMTEDENYEITNSNNIEDTIILANQKNFDMIRTFNDYEEMVKFQ